MSSATPITTSTGLLGRFSHLREEILISEGKRRYGAQGPMGGGIHTISKGIYLGDESGLRSLLKTTSCLEEIDKVFTLCPISQLTDVQHLCLCERSTIEDLLSLRNARWIHVGQTLGDEESEWSKLVAASTDLDGEVSPDEVKTLPYDQWFKEAFEQIDDSLLNGRAIFVHCQMGISRSAAFLTAYLIHRCDVTAREALGFLQARRPCVLTSFLEPLERYQRDLDQIIGPRLRCAQPEGPLAASAFLSPSLVNTISQLKTHWGEKIVAWSALKKLMLEIVEAIGKGDFAFKEAPALLTQELSLLGSLSPFYLKWAGLDCIDNLQDLSAGSSKISALEKLRQEANREIEGWLWREASRLLRRVQTTPEKQVNQLISLVRYCQFSNGLNNELEKIKEPWADQVKTLSKQTLSDQEFPAAFEKTLSDKLQNYFAHLGGRIRQIARERPYGRKGGARNALEKICEGFFVGDELALRALLMSTDQFEDTSVVITAGPLSELGCIRNWFRDESSKPIEEKIRELLAKRNARWICLGDVADNASGWFKMVAACTFPDLDLDPNFVQAEVEKFPCDQWFKSIFDQMDETFLQGKSTLVHSCDGVSRAPALLAAYFIKKCGVTAREALALLQSCHPSVFTKFLKPLEDYEEALNRIAKSK